MKYIKSINWALTYKCNLKCSHCDIWQNPNKQQLSLETIEKIVSSKILRDSYNYYGDFFDIAVSGGEPLLIENLSEIMLLIEKYLPGSIHSISTNGLLKDELINILNLWHDKGKKIRKINFSIDGDEQTHDLQRGIKGSFRKTLETIINVKKIFPEQIIEIKLTITKLNYRYILFLSKLADKLGVFFSFKPAENMNNYTNQKGNIHENFSKEEIDNIEKQIVNNTYIDKQSYYINKNFFYTIASYLRFGLGESKKLCNIANDSINIMPDGKIYSCILMNKIGELDESSIDLIWSSKEIEKQREAIKNGNCPGCMLMCGSFKSKNIYNKGN